MSNNMLAPRSVVGVPLENPGSATTSIFNMMISPFEISTFSFKFFVNISLARLAKTCLSFGTKKAVVSQLSLLSMGVIH